MTRPRKVAIVLWPYIAAVQFFALLWDGLSYLLAPPVLPPDPPGPEPRNDPWVIMRAIPGGLRTHGVLLLTCSALILFALACRTVTRTSELAVTLVFIYGALTTFWMVLAWFVMPHPVWTSPVQWVLIAALALGLLLSPRPRKGERA